ncbi:MAG: SGNH/GDSL hydrolase family protein [Stackebrandtia sp.]
MSYDLAIWDGDRPSDDHQACSTYDELYERYLGSEDVEQPPAPSITAYVKALRERYPDPDVEDVVAAPLWVFSEASGPIAYLTMSYGNAVEVSEHAAALAREHGLVCFDPQTELLRPYPA